MDERIEFVHKSSLRVNVRTETVTFVDRHRAGCLEKVTENNNIMRCAMARVTSSEIIST